MSGSSTCNIADRTVGTGHPPYIIAEIGQAHDGSLGTAHAYIDAVAKAGANAVKFQTHIAHAESSPGEAFRVNVFPQDATRYEYWQRMEFSAAQWQGLADHAKEVGIDFLSTPFSFEAVELLQSLDVPAWKVGSGEVTNLPMLKSMAATGKPILLSSGMSTWAELDEAVATITREGAPVCVFQCTTSYPCPPEEVGLNVIGELAARYGCPTGLSDHSGTIFGSLAAIACGASLIEVHTVFSRDCFGPDVTSSVTNTELAQLVEGAKFVFDAASHPVDKDHQAEARAELRELFGKSLVASRDLPEGTVLAQSDIAVKKPGTGMPAKALDNLIGKRLTGALGQDEQFTDAHLE